MPPLLTTDRQWREGKRVLIVEDDEGAREILAEVFESFGFQALTAANGALALEALRSGPASDLIVLDLMMPVMSGWEFRVAQKQTPALAEIPVVVMSADSDVKARAIDADAFVPKPFDLEHLLHAAESAILLRERVLLERAQRRADEAVRTSEARLRAMVDSSPLAIISSDLEGNILGWNLQAERLYGYRADEVIGRFNPLLRNKPGSFELIREQVLRKGGVRDLHDECTARDGRVLHVLQNLAPLRDASGAMVGVLSMARDVTEARQTERALRRSEETLKAVAANSPLILLATDERGTITLCVGRGLAAAGLDEQALLGKSALESSEPVPWLHQALQRGLAGEEVTASGETNGRVLEAHFRPLRDERKAVTGVVGVAIDNTERRRMEAQLLLSDRMASMGRLAAGVAHEINNPLAFTIANLDFLQRELESPAARAAPRALVEQIQAALHEARQGAERVRLIVRDLKMLSRTDERTSSVDIGAALASALSIAGNEIRHRARLVKQLEPVPLVRGDEGRLAQVFVNLLVNAAQAIPEGSADLNEIRVRARTGSAGEAVVEIADTGAGIPAELLGRLFDPFFTTKPVGLGTGLGLSICHGIVSSLGGRIEVESTVGRGSLFRVVLPSAQAAAAPQQREPAAPAVVEARRGRILVVDDEPSIGSAILRLLSMHEVVAVTEAREALARLDAGEHFDVILCDLMMPDLTGMDLHAEIFKRWPLVAEQMIFMSGGTFTARAEQFLASVQNSRVEKPFQLRNLRQLVAERLR